jgi:anaerobic magnesium-protoporphyrin IX monomethyl ester cyclase
MKPEVLILTGSYLVDKQSTIKSILLKQLNQFEKSEHLWLELKIKFIIAENLIIGGMAKNKILKKFQNTSLARFFNFKLNSETPDLSEVTLATLLRDEKINYRLRSYDELFANRNLLERDLDECTCVFVSATYLKDLSELMPIVERVKRPHNKVVVGGALAGTLCNSWNGSQLVDLLAIGYGEYLVPALASWISGIDEKPKAPPLGRIIQKNHTFFMYSGVPETLSLDDLTSPDWELSEANHQKKYRMIYYESVRGCPYRCAFCNYPYLFDDTKFRTKSALKMVNDWKKYDEMGAEYVTCLDSLFTMPKSRLKEFCEGLINNNIKLKWICYARTDDLCDEEIVELMVKSGCIQVHIGIESGDENILTNMNKRTDPITNELAIKNCHKYHLTTIVTLIVGFPGETSETIDRTIYFLERAPIDFFFIAVFSVRVPGVPILSDLNRKKFGLKVLDNDYSLSPYWSHNSMDCFEATIEARRLTQEIIKRKIGLDATLFYNELLKYDYHDRDELLNFQKNAYENGWIIRICFSFIFRLIDIFFKIDLKDSLK